MIPRASRGHPSEPLQPHLYYGSTGNTASALYTMKKGVKLVDMLGMVHKLHSTEGTSAAHSPALALSRTCTISPSWVRICGFRPCSIMLLVCLTFPFVRGWATVAESMRMLLLSQKSRTFSLVNRLPLSVMMELGTLKQKMMSCMKSTSCLELI
jgi:hypothetical protein